MEVDWNLVKGEIYNIVNDEANILGIEPKDALMIINLNGKRLKQVKGDLMSKNPDQADLYVSKSMKKLTMYDLVGSVSKSFRDLFKHEVEEHNRCLEQNQKLKQFEKINQPIDLEKFALFIELTTKWSEKDQKNVETIKSYFCWDFKPLKPFDIEDEFGEVAKEITDEELKDITNGNSF